MTPAIRAALLCAVFLFTAAAAPRPDETAPGAGPIQYRVWLALKPGRATEVRAFQAYLARQGVSGVFPTYQLLRSESSWARCGGQPFVVPPRTHWPHVVRTLSFIRAWVVPKTGRLEVVSGYRAPATNTCAGGAPQSAHVEFFALDMVPRTGITHDEMVARLCRVHERHGPASRIGLGFYAGMRFHIDSRSFRRWGADHHVASSPCNGLTG